MKFIVFLCSETNEYHSGFKSYTAVHPFRFVLAAVISFSIADHSQLTWTESFTRSAKQSPLFWGSFRISSTTTSSTNLRLQLLESRVPKRKLFSLIFFFCWIREWSGRCVLGKIYLLTHSLCFLMWSKRCLECVWRLRKLHNCMAQQLIRQIVCVCVCLHS